MARKKLQRFAEIDKLPNVAQAGDLDIKEKIKKFVTDAPLVLELACGRGEYTTSMAKLFPDKQFIGIDIQGERIWYGAKEAKEQRLKNVLFLRIQVENLEEYFGKRSIDEIWITFPDPYPRKKQIKKRLTSPRFLQLYKDLLKKEGSVNLKTDDLNLFVYSKESTNDFGTKIIEEIEDIYKKRPKNKLLYIKTYFEKKHIRAKKTINYLKFKFK
ncbi:tRNA (guanosine(46)-N7)-methyltransferase TrmB [Candidatus Parcubacteria bacterium]|nr:MAG: tRNA (guanosine(46)-N7)-methyltransferase TrmB [Candidatus Parcubacteria bacterium]